MTLNLHKESYSQRFHLLCSMCLTHPFISGAWTFNEKSNWIHIFGKTEDKYVSFWGIKVLFVYKIKIEQQINRNGPLFHHLKYSTWLSDKCSACWISGRWLKFNYIPFDTLLRQYLSKTATVDALDNFRALMTNVFLVKFLSFSRTHALVSILSRLDCMYRQLSKKLKQIHFWVLNCTGIKI